MKKKYIQPQTVCESQYIPLTILTTSSWSVTGDDNEGFGVSISDEEASESQLFGGSD